MNTALVFIQKFTHKKGNIILPQTHTCNEIVFYGKGCDGITVINNTEYKFSVGDLSINPAGVQHSEKHFSQGECIFLGFESDAKPNVGLYHNMWDVNAILQSIFQEVIDQKYNYTSIINLRIEEVLLLIERSQIVPSLGNEPNTLLFCKNYINANFPQKISVSDLANMTGYSVDHFRHLFYESFGISPKGYIIRKRCEKAVELLKSTNSTCIDIAYQCGFSDSNQMAKLIKKLYSKTPRQIQNEN